MKFSPSFAEIGFIILCPNNDLGNLKHTIKSLNFWYPSCNKIGVVERGTPKENIDEMKELCPIFKGKTTITSLINTGLRNTKNNWNLVIIAGSWLNGKELKKYCKFCTSEADILFPIIDGIAEFSKGSINGILINKKTFKLIGPMADKGPLNLAKLIWANDAINKKCNFKAVLGPKIN